MLYTESKIYIKTKKLCRHLQLIRKASKTEIKVIYFMVINIILGKQKFLSSNFHTSNYLNLNENAMETVRA